MTGLPPGGLHDGLILHVLPGQITAGVADGSIDIVVGTHALISESVQFNSLGLAIVDEQHR